VRILYRSAVEAVESARQNLRRGEIRERTAAINNAIAILGELTASLNHAAGTELSHSLYALYDYMLGRLIEANFRQSDPPLAEVSKLLGTLLEGWAQIQAQADTAAPASCVSPAYGAPPDDDEATGAYQPRFAFSY